jgi:hypothetical protein
LADHALFKMVRYVLLRPLRPEPDISWSNFHGVWIVSKLFYFKVLLFYTTVKLFELHL